MKNYYDNQLETYLTKLPINNVRIFDNTDSYFMFIKQHFHVKYERVDFSKTEHSFCVHSEDNNLAVDTEKLLASLIHDGICNLEEHVFYLGDSSTEQGYKFCLRDLLRVLPFLFENFPQHHYFLFQEGNGVKLLFVSMENDIEFGISIA